MTIVRENVPLSEAAHAIYTAKVKLEENVILGRAALTIRQMRPTRFENGVPMEWTEIGEAETVWNLVTNVGRIFLHKQGYDLSGLSANGLNFIALSNDAVSETATSTVLSNEIVANGLARAQGAVVLPTGAGNVTTIDKTFTNSGSAQSAQKAALFSAGAGGTMNHVLPFTQRNLAPPDTLQLTFSITLG